MAMTPTTSSARLTGYAIMIVGFPETTPVINSLTIGLPVATTSITYGYTTVTLWLARTGRPLPLIIPWRLLRTMLSSSG